MRVSVKTCTCICVCVYVRVCVSGLGFRVKYSKWRTEEQRVKMRVQEQVMITAFYIFILIFKLCYSQFMLTAYWWNADWLADMGDIRRCFSLHTASQLWFDRGGNEPLQCDGKLHGNMPPPLCVIRRLYAATYSYLCRQIQFSIFY